MTRIRSLCLFASLCLLSLSGIAQPVANVSGLERSVQQQLAQVGELWQRQEYRQAVAILEGLRALPGLDQLDGASQGVFYDLACGYSLLGDKDKALAALASSIKAGFSDYGHLTKDTDLDNIRSDPRFAAAVAPLRAESLLWSNSSWNVPYEDTLSADVKIAGLAKLWAEAKYGFAFFDRVPGLNWDSLFISFVPQVRAASDTREYYRLLQLFAASLRDGHTSVDVPNELFSRMYFRPPLDTRLIENRVIVTNVLDPSLTKKGIRPGLEVTRIDGRPVRAYADSAVAPFQSSSTPQGHDLNTFGFYLLCGPASSPVTLDLVDARGRAFTVTVERSRGQISSYSRPVEFKSLPNGTAYIALNSLGSDAVAAAFDSVLSAHQQSRALVIDLRRNTGGNSRIGFQILGCLTDKPFGYFRSASRSYVASSRAWNARQPWQEKAPGEFSPNGKLCYAKPVVVLTSAETGSAAEDFCVTFDVMKRGAIIGEPTCGSTGQPVSFSLPGGGHGRVCSVRCQYPDGTEFVGVGVQPDLEVSPTISDIRTGRDTVLEAALKYLRESDSGVDTHPLRQTQLQPSDQP